MKLINAIENLASTKIGAIVIALSLLTAAIFFFTKGGNLIAESTTVRVMLWLSSFLFIAGFIGFVAWFFERKK